MMNNETANAISESNEILVYIKKILDEKFDEQNRKFNERLDDFKDRLDSLENKASFYDYLSTRISDHVPQPLSSTPYGNAVNEPRRFWRRERPYRR